MTLKLGEVKTFKDVFFRIDLSRGGLLGNDKFAIFAARYRLFRKEPLAWRGRLN